MKKILIVENDPILRGIYRRKFDLSGFVVEAVDDGPIALETVPEFKPNLIQMDLTLPSMSGTELIRKIRALPARYEVYRVEVEGTHRILYQIKDEAAWILVVKVADRKDVYKRISDLKRLLE